MRKFKFMEQRERKQQFFDKEKITLKKAGKEVNMYDFIQENREDTEIIPTLEKYGSIERIKMNPNKIFADFRELGDLRDIKDQQIKAQEMFYDLPLETRQQFNNNMYEFAKNGEKWLKNKIEQEIKNAEKAEVKAEVKTEVKGAENNG